MVRLLVAKRTSPHGRHFWRHEKQASFSRRAPRPDPYHPSQDKVDNLPLHGSLLLGKAQVLDGLEAIFP
jgi:hypothetical protein